jgi:uncharacterized protein YndB with AHSA1/START domain
MSKRIRQSVTIKASPHAIYEAPMDSHQHFQFTGQPAYISRKVGGRFIAYGDDLSGTTLELVSDKRIVQAW